MVPFKSAGLTSSDLAPGLALGKGVKFGSEIELGANVVIHAGVEIGDRCSIGDSAVLGKTPKLSMSSTATRDTSQGSLQLDEEVVICAGAVVFAATGIGHSTIVGDQAYVRERTQIGNNTVIGRATAVDNDVQIGSRVRVQSNCYITAYSVVEDDVFVGPGVVMTNDNTMARHPREVSLRGPTLRRACRIGGGAVLAPGVEIGEEAYVAAGAVVVGDVEPRAVVMGVPARQLREVPESDLLERWQ